MRSVLTIVPTQRRAERLPTADAAGTSCTRAAPIPDNWTTSPYLSRLLYDATVSYLFLYTPASIAVRAGILVHQIIPTGNHCMMMRH